MKRVSSNNQRIMSKLYSKCYLGVKYKMCYFQYIKVSQQSEFIYEGYYFMAGTMLFLLD